MKNNLLTPIAKIGLLSIILALLISTTFSPISIVRAANVYFVRPSGSDASNCSTWENACSLQTAISQLSTGDEIWAAAGVYYPGEDSSNYFVLPGGVSIFGGFAGNETQLSERDWEANLTILSGDVDKNDLNTDGNYIAESSTDIQGKNSEHVVKFDGIGGGTTLDGFVVTAGQSVSEGGGGLFIRDSSPTLRNLTILGNEAGSGGGIYIWHDPSNVTIVNTRFIGNSANYGGGVYIGWNTSMALTNVVFIQNSASIKGGAITIYAAYAGLVNGVFQENSSPSGGAIELTESSTSLKNVTFFGNTAENYSCYLPTRSTASMNNVIIWGNPAINDKSVCEECGLSITYSDIEGGYPGIGNINKDPLFLDGPGGNLRVSLLSPAIDSGSNSALPSEIATDLDGKTRFVDIPTVPDIGEGTAPIVDMGAYERYEDATAPVVNAITRLDPSPTTAESVRFKVIFSEPVIGLAVEDFHIISFGNNSGATVMNLNLSGAIRMVTVNTGSGGGSLRLDIPLTATITDLVGNPVVNIPFISGESYQLMLERLFLPLIVR